MQDIPFRSAKQLASLIRRRKIGCLELLDLYLARMARHNPRLNAEREFQGFVPPPGFD